MELLSLKLIVLTISGVIRLFFGLIPLVLIRTLRKNVSGKQSNKIVKYVISVLMFFGGGVLLATCFLHMMPEVRVALGPENVESELPVPELIFITGFFFVYFLEEVVHGVIHRRRRNKKKRLDTNPSVGTDKLKLQNRNEFLNGVNGFRETKEIYGRDVTGPNNDLPGFIPRIRSPTDNKFNTSFTPTTVRDSNFSTTETSLSPNYCCIDPDWWKDTVNTNSQMNLVTASVITSSSLHENHLNDRNKAYAPMTPPKVIKGPSSDWSVSSSHTNEEDKGHSHLPIGIDEEDESVAGAIRNLLIVVAISFHGVFEGLAIGLQGTEKDVWALFLAVSLHECTILFCIGVELISAQTKVVRMISYIMVVSLVSPLGIAVGIVISEKSVGGSLAHTLLVGSLQGLAAGTLLYVTFFEIFAAEGRKLHSKFIHILVAILGFVMMASLEFLGGHGHGHGSHHTSITPGNLNRTLSDGETGHDSHDHEYHEHDHERRRRSTLI